MRRTIAARLALELSERRTIVAAVIMLALFTLSALLPLVSPGILEGPLGEEARKQVESIEKAGGDGLVALPKVIFLNNVRVSIIIAATYFTVIIPAAIIAMNGFVIGYLPLTGIMSELASALGAKGAAAGAALLYYAGLVPHGLLELTSIVLVASLVGSGIRGGVRGIATRILDRLVMAIVNLAIAAIVETFITPVAILIVLTLLLIA